jgi:hypothetical protein
MDVSDLPESARRLIAAAEIEAKYILRKSQEAPLYSTKAPNLQHEYESGNVPECEEFAEGRNQAALHLFNATAEHWWERVKPDVKVFGARLQSANLWVARKFQCDPKVLNDAIADRLESARTEAAELARSGLGRSQRPVGALRAAAMRHGQALREGRIEPPSLQPVSVPRALASVERQTVDGDYSPWRSIREDFESLPLAEWSLIWSSRRPVMFFLPIQLPSQWTWFHPTDASLRTRASAIFLKAAKARGYNSEDQWLDELRYADFVRFQNSGYDIQKLPDGTIEECESGVLDDAINHSITLCYQLEAGSAPKPIVGRLPREAIARLEAATAAFMAEYLPKLEPEGPKLEHEQDTRVREAKLLRELVINHFETAARECMTLCASVAEFEAELRAGIAQFVQFRVGQYRLLGDTMRSELNAGFAFFVMRADPWVGIPEGERDSRWHVGAIIGETLSDSSLRLIAEATARAEEGGFGEPERTGAAESGGDELPGTDGSATKRLRATVSSTAAARKMEAYMESHDGQTAFATKVGTTDRTLRSFRQTGRVRRDIFIAIAGAMGTTRDELIKPE